MNLFKTKEAQEELLRLRAENEYLKTELNDTIKRDQHSFEIYSRLVDELRKTVQEQAKELKKVKKQ